jgi:uncharacterized protein (TIGR00645 family)
MTIAKWGIEDYLIKIGDTLYKIRAFMSIYYIGLAIVVLALTYKFLLEIFKFVNVVLFSASVTKVELILKVLELVDMTMVVQLVWVVCMAGFSLFVTAKHFEENNSTEHSASGTLYKKEKPDWLDHVNTYNLKLKLAFAMISISGVHALRTYLEGGDSNKVFLTVIAHFLFVISAIGIAFAEYITKKKCK